MLDIVNNPENCQVIEEYTDILIDSCKSGDLLEIAIGLDGFYEVFSEECYDSVL